MFIKNKLSNEIAVKNMELNERDAIICCSMQKATKNKFDTEKPLEGAYLPHFSLNSKVLAKVHFLTETLLKGVTQNRLII